MKKSIFRTRVQRIAAATLTGTLFCIGQVHAQTTPAVGSHGSIWVHNGNQVGRLDMTSATTATFTALPVLQFGDFNPTGNNVMTDIAWAPDYSTMYAVTRHLLPDNVVFQGLSQFNPNTGIGSILSDNNDIGQVNATVANGAGFVGGVLYTAVDDLTELFSINTSTGLFSEIGTVTAGGINYYGSGDIVSYNGITYSLSMRIQSEVGQDGYLINLNVADPASSSLVGLMGTGSASFTNGFGIAAIEGVGLYAIGNGKEVYLIDVDNPSNLTAVTITGDTSAFAVFNGATAAPIPEPATFALLGAGLGLVLLKRRRVF